MMDLTVRLLIGAAIPGLLLACAGPESSGDVKTGPARGEAVEIVADDSFFKPETVDLRAGEEVTFEIANDGEMPHEFSIEEFGISTGTIQPGEIRTVTFKVPQGRTEFVCIFHRGMDGTIVAGETGDDQ